MPDAEALTKQLIHAVDRFTTCVERLTKAYSPSDDEEERLSLIADILSHVYGDDLDSLLEKSWLQKGRTYDESKHNRDNRGRWAPKGTPALFETTQQLVADSLKGSKTRESVNALVDALGELTVKQLHEIKRKYDIKASGKNKAELLNKIAQRLDAGRRESASGGDLLPTTGGKPLSAAEMEAVIDYQGSSYKAVNSYLRDGEKANISKAAKDEAKETIKLLDSAFEKSGALTKDTVVYRGVNDKSIGGLLKDPVGKTYTDSAYLSTMRTKRGWFGERKVVMEITVPEGTKVVQPRGENDFEQEVLLNRGTPMTVTGVRKEGGQTILEMKFTQKA